MTREVSPHAVEYPILFCPVTTWILLAVAFVSALVFVATSTGTHGAIGAAVEHDDEMRAKAVQEVKAALESKVPGPTGTWAQLEDGTARCEWLYSEPTDEWGRRALFAAGLANDMNGRTR